MSDGSSKCVREEQANAEAAEPPSLSGCCL
jgi:hypothetical protein